MYTTRIFHVFPRNTTYGYNVVLALGQRRTSKFKISVNHIDGCYQWLYTWLQYF